MPVKSERTLNVEKQTGLELAGYYVMDEHHTVPIFLQPDTIKAHAVKLAKIGATPYFTTPAPVIVKEEQAPQVKRKGRPPTTITVDAIMALKKRNFSTKDIARKLDCSVSTIYSILRSSYVCF